MWVLSLGQAYQGLDERGKAMAALRIVLMSDANDVLRQKAEKRLADLE